MINDELKELVRYRMEQSRDALRAAEVLSSQGLTRDSVNRSYYAMFYCVLAVLATKSLGTSKHSGAISLFNREFVKAGLFSKDLSEWIHGAFNKRIKADYADKTLVTHDEASLLVKKAADFVAAVTSYLNQVI